MASISKQQAEEILERFQRGETSLAEERARLGIRHNNSIRHALRQLVGADAYAALIKAAKKPRAAL